MNRTFPNQHSKTDGLPMPGPLIQRPIFVVGAGRSGTTLMRSLLSAHPHIAIAPETQFMQQADRGGGLALGAPMDAEAFWARYTASVRFKDLGVEAARCRELISEQGLPTYQHIFSALLAAYRERVGKERVGEKSPRHVRYLEELLMWYPEARVVVMQRDPRAVVASQLRTPWSQSQVAPLSLRQGVFVNKRVQELAFYAANWRDVYGRIVPRWQADNRVLVVAYEALVQDAEGELRRICDFLDEPYEPAMVTRRAEAGIHTPSAAMVGVPEQWRREHYASTLRPVSADALQKWKTELSNREVAMVEGLCGWTMQTAGYATSTSAYARATGRALTSGMRAGGGAEAALRSGLATARHWARSARRRLRRER